jgi:hypothetical protein
MRRGIPRPPGRALPPRQAAGRYSDRFHPRIARTAPRNGRAPSSTRRSAPRRSVRYQCPPHHSTEHPRPAEPTVDHPMMISPACRPHLTSCPHPARQVQSWPESGGPGRGDLRLAVTATVDQPDPASGAHRRFFQRYRGCREAGLRAARLTNARGRWRRSAPVPNAIENPTQCSGHVTAGWAGWISVFSRHVSIMRPYAESPCPPSLGSNVWPGSAR